MRHCALGPILCALCVLRLGLPRVRVTLSSAFCECWFLDFRGCELGFTVWSFCSRIGRGGALQRGVRGGARGVEEETSSSFQVVFQV